MATPGAAGADLANMINEAALRAVKESKKRKESQEDLLEAVELIIAGEEEKKDRIMTASEKRIVAFHEVGHAMTAALQTDAAGAQDYDRTPDDGRFGVYDANARRREILVVEG